MTLDDLLQEGRIGLFKAIERYDLDMNLRLSTYATWWIRQSIGRALADQDRTIRLPVHVVETLRRMRQTTQNLTDAFGREPTDEELADALRLPLKKVQTIRRMERDPISLELPVGPDGDSLLGDLLPDPRLRSPVESASYNALREAIGRALNRLTERERQVIVLRFGLADGKVRTLESIGKVFGVTRERIRQIEVKALRHLSHPRLSRLLRDYLE
jgi:RNA polymerase primary sigma factor